MSMMLPPDPSMVPGPPGGGGPPDMGGGMPPGMGGGLPPMDAMNQGPLPADGGMEGLLAALGQQGPQGPGAEPLAAGLPGEGEGEEGGEMDPVEHIQVAMKHLMMALAKDDDEERGHGLVKGMGALQSILGGEQKKNAQLSALSG